MATTVPLWAPVGDADTQKLSAKQVAVQALIYRSAEAVRS